MAPRTRVPGKDVLLRWREAGYTQAEMVDLTLSEFGEQVSRSAIAAAMVRHGIADEAPRYADYVPWQINPIHATATPLRNLRFMGRRAAGNPLNAREADLLDAWLRTLAKQKLIVAYDFDDQTGFYYISAKHKDHKGPAPIRRRQLNMAATEPVAKKATRRKKT